MRYYILLFSLIAFLQHNKAQQIMVNNVNALDFSELIKNTKGTLLDVRTIREYKNAHIQGAGQLNFYDPDFLQQLLLLSKEDSIFLYCNVGFRSLRAANMLTQNGYTKVFNLTRGVLEWHQNGLPLVAAPDAEPDVENQLDSLQYFELINTDGFVFIDFYAPWCAPCRKMMPMIDEIAEKYKDKIIVKKINIDASKPLVKILELKTIPYFSLHKKGQLLFNHEGFLEKEELERHLQSFLKK